MINIKRTCVALFLVFSVCTASLHAQDHPGIVITTLNPISVSESQAYNLSRLLEYSFIRTGVYDVIEQKLAAEILQDRAYLLFDCTDEKCAVSLGKILDTQQVVMGSVSMTESRYVIDASIIEVNTGRKIKADRVEAESFEGLKEVIDLLAYKLTGLTLGRRGEERMAGEFEELRVETDPDGAEVLINGVRKGVSPVEVEKVPKGWVYVEARKGNMYGYAEVDMGVDGPVEMKLELEKSLGSIFIETGEREVEVYVDGLYLGGLGSGEIVDVTVGEHEVVLRGDGLWWEGSVTVKPDQSTRVEANPYEVGSITYRIPEGAKAEIRGENFRRVVRGYGVIENTLAGTYEAEVTGEDYETELMTLFVRIAESAQLIPKFEYTEGYAQTPEIEESETHVDQLRYWKAELEIAYERSLKRRRTFNAAAEMTFYTGVLSFALSGLALIMSRYTYSKYQGASLTYDAIDYRNKSQTWKMVSIVTVAAGGGLELLSIISIGLGGNPQKINDQISEIDRMIEELEGVEK